ncbi:MAG TPA: helix-turn-helix domain-containing protein [Polyangiaceae bacterium]
MTVKEVAKALRVCTATVYGMIEKGELEHFRVNNAIRVLVRLSPLSRLAISAQNTLELGQEVQCFVRLSDGSATLGP